MKRGGDEAMHTSESQSIFAVVQPLVKGGFAGGGVDRSRGFDEVIA